MYRPRRRPRRRRNNPNEHTDHDGVPRMMLHQKDMEVLQASSEDFRIEVDAAFRQFSTDPSLNEYSFPANLNTLQRKYIHQKALSMGMTSRSHGKDPNRILTLYKRHNASNFESFYISLTSKSQARLDHFMAKYKDFPRDQNAIRLQSDEKVFGKLLLGKPPEVGPPMISDAIAEFQYQLPVYEMKNEIVEKIRANRVVIVSSETGSGKTTQIPQYIMDDARQRGEPCRIICTQPRRISAVSVAARVSKERGTPLGETVGYHIRLQSKLGTKSNLIYCTNGVLIRSLMSGDEVLSCLTHIIIDEVHERDRLSDFLLICLREFVRNGKNVKVILMSATINIEKFQNYFGGNVEVISIPGRLFKINQQFLDDVLHLTNYTNVVVKDQPLVFDNDVTPIQDTPLANHYFDELIVRCSIAHDDDVWDHLFLCVFSEGMSPNYQHTKTGYTPLMVAVEKNNVTIVERMIMMGANPCLKNRNGITAIQMAEELQNEDICLLLNQSISMSIPHTDLLAHYYKTVADDDIDYNLITQLICTIHRNYEKGAILVFLPGYDDIMICNDRIMESDLNPKSYQIFFLHGAMDIQEQHGVFNSMHDKRKIILSTNIAETSLTIDDVKYVIDSGKAKEQTYDSLSGLSSLQVQWISKACVKQRAGRAGRTHSGICFHLFSKARYQSLVDERIPEILRVPLEELCLNTKSIAGNFSSIYNFLELAPDPPSTTSVRMAINNLICLGALDEDEKLTTLGEYLSQLTIEPHLGKTLIYSVIFKCLDPILTIVASLAQKDPFQLPPNGNLRIAAVEKRKSLTENAYSDHLIYLKAFIKWQESTMNRRPNNFCREYFISKSTMETILKTRCQLLGQLRAAKFVAPSKHAMRNLNTFSQNWPLIKAVIAAGLYPKFAFQKGGNFCTRTEKKVVIHHSSSLRRKNIPVWVIYDDMIKIRQSSQIRGVTAITPITVTLVCGNNSTNPFTNCMNIDNWLEFEFPNDHIYRLRKALEKAIEKILLSPSNVLEGNDLLALETFADVLYHEEISADLCQPYGIKYKPKFFEIVSQEMGYPYPQPNSSSDSFMQLLPHFAKSDNYSLDQNGGVECGSSNEFVGDFNVARYNGNLESVMEPFSSLSVSQEYDAVVDMNSQLYPSTLEGSLNGFQFTFLPNGDRIDINNSVFLLLKVKECSVNIAYNTSEWRFAPKTEKLVILYYTLGKDIYLIFSDSETRNFCGIAQFLKMIGRKGLRARIYWKYQLQVPFSKTSHLRNPLCDLRLIHEATDGQIIPIEVAIKLFTVFHEHYCNGKRPIVKSNN